MARGCVLLTGGTGRGHNAVKDRAIRGALQAGKDGHVAAWVGVERTKRPQPAERRGSGLILRPGYEHKRNYVEAHLCDAAIAFYGKEGTASEVAFCLALGRPVVLVGSLWKANYALSKKYRPGALALFRENAMTQMRRREQPSPLDPVISDAYERLAGDLPLPAVRYRQLPTRNDDSRRIVKGVLDLVDMAALAGNFPVVADYGGMARTYSDWLKQIDTL